MQYLLILYASMFHACRENGNIQGQTYSPFIFLHFCTFSQKASHQFFHATSPAVLKSFAYFEIIFLHQHFGAFNDFARSCSTEE